MNSLHYNISLKSTLSFLFFVVILILRPSASKAQCMMYPVSLKERTEQAQTIVLGKLKEKICYINPQNNTINTLNIIEISAYLKGDYHQTTVGVISSGGTVGNQSQITYPSLQLNYDNEYILFLSTDNKSLDNKTYRNSHPEIIQAQAYADAQGAITKQFGYYHDLYSEPKSTEEQIFNKIKNITGKEIIDEHGMRFFPRNDDNNHSMMSITSFSPTTTNAGTIVAGDYLSITGSSFGGSGTVYYSNADNGGATFVSSGVSSDNVSWSTTAITNKVAGAAGTGPINVNGTMTSATSLTVDYAHICINSNFSGFGATTRQRFYLRNLNGSGGYTFVYNTTSGFSGNASAVAAFQRAVQTWRCAIYVNFFTGGTTTSGYGSDNKCTVLFDASVPAGVLAITTTWFTGGSQAGCTTTNTVWWAKEMDIQIKPDPPVTGYTWNWGPAAPTASQYDFESVMLHELGHAVGLGHTIAPGTVMHYAISNGANQRTLTTSEINGGNAKMAYSTAATCFNPSGSGTQMIAVNVGECLLLPIELTDFTGTYIDQTNSTLLQWQTVSEFNNDHFTVERSSDGENFQPIGTIAGAGNSMSELNYHFTDYNPAPGINYYRLQQTDFNGVKTYSNTISINASGSQLINVYPNPAGDILNLNFNYSLSDEIVVNIFSVTGELMISEKMNSNNSEYFKLNTKLLPAGLYFINVSNENSSDASLYSAKFVKE